MISKKLKSIISTVTVIVMVFCIMSGCTKTENKQANGASNTSAVSTKDGNMVGNVYKTGLPIVKDKVTLKAVVKTNVNLKQPAKNLLMWKQLEDETNVALDLEEVPDASFNEKFNLMVASSSLPDFFINSISDITTKYYKSGVFLQLNDLIKTWAPSVQKAIDDPVQYANLKSPDGKLYTFPAGELAECTLLNPQLFLNKVWLQKLNLKIPETTDDLYNVLKAFKEKDPNGNGKADEISMSIELSTATKDSSLGYCLFGAFGLPVSNRNEMIMNGQYIFGPTKDEYRDALMFYNKLYVNGLLDKESFTQSRSDIKTKANGTEALVGALLGFWPDNYMDSTKVDNYQLVPPLKGPKGYQMWEGKALCFKAGPCISKQCKYPEVVARWIDNMNSDPIKKALTAYGPESIGVISIKGDKYEVNSDKAPQGMTYEAWSRNNTLREMAPIFSSVEETDKTRILDPVTQRKTEYVKAYVPYMNKDVITTGTFSSISAEDNSTIISIDADMTALINNFISKSIIEGITDSTWSKFQSDLKKAGVDKYIEIKSKAVAEYNKTIGKK